MNGTWFLKIPHLAVAVVSGRIRTLVERFERRDKFDGNEDQATSILSPVIPEDQTTSILSPVIPKDQTTCISTPVIPKDQTTCVASPVIPEVEASICSPVIPEVEANISRPVIPERDTASTMLVNISAPRGCFSRLKNSQG